MEVKAFIGCTSYAFGTNLILSDAIRILGKRFLLLIGHGDKQFIFVSAVQSMQVAKFTK